MKISTTDIVAFLGALAWLPQVIYFSYKVFVKSKISILPAKSFELGFSLFGPILNLKLSINTKAKDTVLEHIGIELCNKSDDATRKFEWAGMREVISEIRANDGYTQQVQREFQPTALRTSTNSLVERDFRFQETSFLKMNRKEIVKIDEKFNYLRKNNHEGNNDSIINLLIDSKEYNDYLNFIESYLWWRPGKYTVTFTIRSLDKINFIEEKYYFYLSQDEIDLLQSNIEQIKKFINLQYESILQGKAMPSIHMNWLYPNLCKIKN